MKSNRKIITFLILFGLTVSCLFTLSACGKNNTEPPKTETPETNPLYAYEEIREFNYNSKIPYILGSTAEEIGKTFERVSGTIDHCENYRSKQVKDLAYTLSRIEAVCGEAAPASPVYATAVSIVPENKKITSVGNGKTKVEYISSRTVLGVKLGQDINDAEAVFKKFGYEKIYEEIKTSNLPKSREFTFKKGILLISCNVEVKNDISFMRAWVSMQNESIDRVNSQSNLPADLGLHYSVYANPDFVYDSKTEQARIYKHKDGATTCTLRGFPDARDMLMNAGIYFESNQYDVFGAKTGMTVEEAAEKLVSAGCSAKPDEEDMYACGIVLVKLNSDGGIVKSIEVSLIESTQLPDLRDSGK